MIMARTEDTFREEFIASLDRNDDQHGNVTVNVNVDPERMMEVVQGDEATRDALRRIIGTTVRADLHGSQAVHAENRRQRFAPDPSTATQRALHETWASGGSVSGMPSRMPGEAANEHVVRAEDFRSLEESMFMDPHPGHSRGTTTPTATTVPDVLSHPKRRVEV